jgi:hypothetical protein
MPQQTAPQNHVKDGIIAVLAIALIATLAYSSTQRCQHTARRSGEMLDDCIRSSEQLAKTTIESFGTTNPFCLDYKRNPLVTSGVSPCPNPGTIRVYEGIEIKYSNIKIQYVAPNHLCIKDTSQYGGHVLCSEATEVDDRSEEKQTIGVLKHVYKDWTIGHPHDCTSRMYVNGDIGVCMRPSIRTDSKWTQESFLTLSETKKDTSPHECALTDPVISTQMFSGKTKHRFYSIYFNGGVVRVAKIADKNFYVVGNPTQTDIEKAIDDHIKNAEDPTTRTDTLISTSQQQIVNSVSLIDFVCSGRTCTLQSET